MTNTEKPGYRKKVNNDDMHMDPARLAQLSQPVRTAMSQEVIVDLFDHFETEANRSKRFHNRVGGTSLVLLIAALEFATFEPLANRFGVIVPAGLNTGILIVGIIPFVLAVICAAAKFHEDWVLARFKAERIRHWKFQQLLDGRYIESLVAGSPAKGPFAKAWDDLLAEIDGGVGHMHTYVDERPFDSPFQPHHYTDEAVFLDALSTYHQYRLNLQLNWFTQEREHYKRIDKRTETAAGTLLFLGAAAAFLEGILHFVSSNPLIEPGLAAAGVGMTLLSAGVRVYRSASGVSESAERYQRLASQVGWLGHEVSQLSNVKPLGTSGQEKLLRVIFEVERICHGEMVEFIRVAKKSDYLM